MRPTCVNVRTRLAWLRAFVTPKPKPKSVEPYDMTHLSAAIDAAVAEAILRERAAHHADDLKIIKAPPKSESSIRASADRLTDGDPGHNNVAAFTRCRRKHVDGRGVGAAGTSSTILVAFAGCGT
jgi:hypothetical protein